MLAYTRYASPWYNTVVHLSVVSAYSKAVILIVCSGSVEGVGSERTSRQAQAACRRRLGHHDWFGRDVQADSRSVLRADPNVCIHQWVYTSIARCGVAA